MVDDEREERRHTNMEVREWLRGRAMYGTRGEAMNGGLAPQQRQPVCGEVACKIHILALVNEKCRENVLMEKLHVNFIFSHSRKLEVENFEYS